MNSKMQNNYTQNGNLIVSVYTASGAIPIEGAMVTVKGSNAEDSGIKTVVYTDNSGNTAHISLPAPPVENSEVPVSASPFAKYNIEVDKEGFYSRTFIDVPVFANTTSIQPVNLIPQNEYQGEALIPNEGIITESQNPNL